MKLGGLIAPGKDGPWPAPGMVISLEGILPGAVLTKNLTTARKARFDPYLHE